MGADRKPLEDKHVSLNRAAMLLGESRTGVLARIARRELDTELSAGRTVVTLESVERVKKAKAESCSGEAEQSVRKRARR